MRLDARACRGRTASVPVQGSKPSFDDLDLVRARPCRLRLGERRLARRRRRRSSPGRPAGVETISAAPMAGRRLRRASTFSVGVRRVRGEHDRLRARRVALQLDLDLVVARGAGRPRRAASRRAASPFERHRRARAARSRRAAMPVDGRRRGRRRRGRGRERRRTAAAAAARPAPRRSRNFRYHERRRRPRRRAAAGRRLRRSAPAARPSACAAARCGGMAAVAVGFGGSGIGRARLAGARRGRGAGGGAVAGSSGEGRQRRAASRSGERGAAPERGITHRALVRGRRRRRDRRPHHRPCRSLRGAERARAGGGGRTGAGITTVPSAAAGAARAPERP